MLRRIFPDEFIAIATLIVAMASFVSFGCDEKPSWKEPGPEATFETFLMDWYRGDYEAAFATIAPDDRARLTEPLEELEGKLDEEKLPKEVEMLVVGRVDNPYDIKDVELAEALDSEPKKGQEVRVVLEYHDGREGQAQLIWGGDRWFVDLPLAGERQAGANPTDEEPIGSDAAEEQQPDQVPSQAASKDAGAANANPGDASDGSAAGDVGPPNSNEEQ